ncbi:MAG: acetaldehyde dehydrogenase, partial [Bacteroidota bacterium]|nr:acetaldehyde dehydrogenase [Bacteroidota bacterium]
GIGKEYPLSREKLSPVLSFYIADGWREGCHLCWQMLEFGGLGHTMAIHSTDEDIILKFGLEKPACRILVNTQTALGAVGYTNELLPSMTLGPGTFGHSIISDNVSAKHLINIKRLAFETRPINQISVNSIQKPEEKNSQPMQTSKPKVQTQQPQKSWIEEIEERIRLKAGNAPIEDKSKKVSVHTEKAEDQVFGEGISKEKVDELIKKFSTK